MQKIEQKLSFNVIRVVNVIAYNYNGQNEYCLMALYSLTRMLVNKHKE